MAISQLPALQEQSLSGHDPEQTWIEIVEIGAWFGSRGWRSIL